STNAVISGLFFDPKGSQPSPSGSATFLTPDTMTEGNWQVKYGSEGYNVIDNSPPSSYPSYAQVSVSGYRDHVWTSSTTDKRALQDAVGTGRIAACWVSNSSFTVNVNITDGQTHQLALYLLDWDQNGARSERVDILDAATGSVLSTQSVSGFQNGEYLVWNVSGDVNIRITNLNDPNNLATNAVLSGLFFAPAAASSSAGFVKTDTTTAGNWKGVYGNQGYNVIDNASSYPSYAQVSVNGNRDHVWTSSTTDMRALQDAVGFS